MIYKQQGQGTQSKVHTAMMIIRRRKKNIN